jgi:citrate synthase
VSAQVKELVPGLAGIPAAESSISYIDGKAGVLEYRGIRIEELACRSGFEEVCWLLLFGELPTRAQLDGFRARLAEARHVAPDLVRLMASLPPDGHPMDALQAGLAALGMYGGQRRWSESRDVEAACIELIAATPVIVAAYHAGRTGRALPEPQDDLDTAAGFLWLLNGERPDEIAARILDVCLVLHADHTMNASTFTARVITSTEADPYTVCSGAVGSLTGALHGGANERVLKTLEAIGGPDDVPAWVERTLASRGKIMGFGHRVYSVKDPRAIALQDLVRELFARLGSTPIYDVATRLEEEVTERLGHKGIYPNVDFFSGIVYQKLGIPTDVFTPVFAIARIAGWLAHWREQMQGNKLFRPGQVYVGGHGGEYVPIDQRR